MERVEVLPEVRHIMLYSVSPVQEKVSNQLEQNKLHKTCDHRFREEGGGINRSVDEARECEGSQGTVHQPRWATRHVEAPLELVHERDFDLILLGQL
jgi:hypothetical protein